MPGNPKIPLNFSFLGNRQNPAKTDSYWILVDNKLPRGKLTGDCLPTEVEGSRNETEVRKDSSTSLTLRSE